MGSCGSNDAQPEQTEGNTLHVLCLGGGGCGKSTFVKQMKLIHHEAWDDIELENYSKIIRANMVYGLQEALDEAKRAKTAISDIEEATNVVLDIRPRAVDLSDVEVKKNLLEVYNHKDIQKLLNRENNTELSVDSDHLRYYYEHFDRIADPAFVPTDKDILMCRQRTAGASTTSIYINKKYFEFTDVGGQKPEQHKWPQILQQQHYAAILFFVASNEYDMTSSEDPERTKMAISRKIFGEVCNSEQIGDSPIVLLLNKLDLFHSKLGNKKGWKSFKATFPDYKGTQEDIPALNYIADTYKGVLDPSRSKDMVLNVHNTCALDTEALSVVWTSIREGIVRSGLSKAGYL